MKKIAERIVVVAAAACCGIKLSVDVVVVIVVK